MASEQEMYVVLETMLQNATDEEGNFHRSAQKVVDILHLLYIKQISLSEFLERVEKIKAAGEPTFGAEHLK
jgi:hypothetical protein